MKAYELFHPRTKKQIGFMWLKEDVRVCPNPDIPHFLELRDSEGWVAVFRDAQAKQLESVRLEFQN